MNTPPAWLLFTPAVKRVFLNIVIAISRRITQWATTMSSRISLEKFDAATFTPSRIARRWFNRHSYACSGFLYFHDFWEFIELFTFHWICFRYYFLLDFIAIQFHCKIFLSYEVSQKPACSFPFYFSFHFFLIFTSFPQLSYYAKFTTHGCYPLPWNLILTCSLAFTSLDYRLYKLHKFLITSKNASSHFHFSFHHRERDTCGRQGHEISLLHADISRSFSWKLIASCPHKIWRRHSIVGALHFLRLWHCRIAKCSTQHQRFTSLPWAFVIIKVVFSSNLLLSLCSTIASLFRLTDTVPPASRDFLKHTYISPPCHTARLHFFWQCHQSVSQNYNGHTSGYKAL